MPRLTPWGLVGAGVALLAASGLAGAVSLLLGFGHAPAASTDPAVLILLAAGYLCALSGLAWKLVRHLRNIRRLTDHQGGSRGPDPRP